MNAYRPALLLAAAMIAIAFLAVFEVIPERYAQFAPIALLALFPRVWLGRGDCFRAKA